MLQQSEIEKTLLGLKPELASKFHVNRIGYFGSYARNQQTQDSDIDILVEFKKPIGWEFFDLQELLEKELKLKVDLVSINALRIQLKDTILNQVKYV
ncbi:MAG: nucleotidyltransferase family protein [Bacteroidetes bacterium]|nr:nucleotidyltransferase family protein [Bacteroidota bacterium]